MQHVAIPTTPLQRFSGQIEDCASPDCFHGTVIFLCVECILWRKGKVFSKPSQAVTAA